MTHCLFIYGRKKQEEKRKKVKKVEKNKNKETLKKLISKRFWKWKRVFRKKELERMPVQKTWDHAIELKERFMPKKGKVYLLLREEREGVQAFLEDQLRKGYIQPSKLPQTSSTLCGKKRWHTENGAGLSIHKSVDDKEWVPLTSHCRHTG